MKFDFPNIGLSRWDYVAILICSIPAFYLLGHPAIYIWDEAVYANASLDMSQGKSWWVPLQAAYNTKPPLVLWMQAISLNIFSPWPEFAIRFPSALSVTGILLMLVFALKRWGFSQWPRIFVLVFFVANEGFIRHHISRTGDLDAVMCFFVTGYTLLVLDSIHFQKWNKRYRMLFFIMVTGAFYAKSVAGLIMLGPVVLIWFLSPLRKVLFTFSFWKGALLSVCICLLYYVTREMIQPGFISLAWNSEYMRMFSDVMPWHAQPFNFYFKNFICLHTYNPWLWFVMVAIGYGLFMVKQKSERDHFLRWMILSMVYLFIISIPADKLEWYDAPVYPFFALLLGATAGILIRNVPSRMKLICIIPLGFFLWRKLDFIRHDIQPRHPLEYEGSILRHTHEPFIVKILAPVETPEHRLQLDFYTKLIAIQNGIAPLVIDSIEQIEIADKVIVNQERLSKISATFEIDTMINYPQIGAEVRIIDVKSK